MHKEVLEITPAGGIYCLVDFKTSPESIAIPEVINCARPNGYEIQNLLHDIRVKDFESDGFLTDGDILRWALSYLCETSLGRSLSHDARFDGWMIAVEDGDEWSDKGQIDTAQKCLYLPRYSDSIATFSRSQPAQMQFLFQLLKGLRLIWQDNTYSGNTEELSAEEYLRFERLIDADGDLCGLLAGYQLRESGDHDLWRYILSSDLHPLAITLCECLDFDASADNTLDTLGFVFQDWFSDDARLAKIDHASLTKLDSRSDTDFGTAAIGFEDLIQLSMMPDGFSYLEYPASEILSDEFYVRMTDPVNAAHLRQIACESQIHLIEEIGFRDPDLARKFFPNSTFETIV